ncbi:hypothetical protein BC826DRAFT_1001659 [Russula brevipes]|nr:hypothetical protein BC826DRAFT_1001659 [Russula brevipes]
MSVLAAITSLLLFSGFTTAGIVAPDCSSLIDWTWTYNSRNQNPCTVAAYLGGTCNQNSFTINSLLPGYSYTGPSGVDNGNLCKCSTVMYSLISACDACQGQDWITWAEYSFNCTTKFPASSFPNPVPDGTSVPQWALFDMTLENSWNVTTAHGIGDSPEIAAGQPIGTAASTSRFNGGPTGSTSQSLPSSSGAITSSTKKKTNGGAIAGGVAAGVVCIGIAGAIFFFCRRQSRARAPLGSSTVNADSQPLYHESPFIGASHPQSGGSPIAGESTYSGSGAMGGMQAPSIGSSAFIGGFQAPSIVSAINSTSQEPLASPSSASGGQSAAQLLMAEARQSLPDYSSRTGSPLTQMTFDPPNFTSVVPESSRGAQYVPAVPSQLPPTAYKAGAANMQAPRQNEYRGYPMV